MQIEITTNGTILPKEDLIPYLQNNKAVIRISDYGELVNKDKLIGFCEANKIRYEVLGIEAWVSPGGIEKRGRAIEELKKLYDRCYSAYYCKTLYDGKLFPCARAASLYALGAMKEQDYVEINAETKTEELLTFITRDYAEACDYCDKETDNKKYVEPAEQM